MPQLDEMSLTFSTQCSGVKTVGTMVKEDIKGFMVHLNIILLTLFHFVGTISPIDIFSRSVVDAVLSAFYVFALS